MMPFDPCREPTAAALLEIEAESDQLLAELTLVEAECRWYANPSPNAAADLLEALAAVTDSYYLAGQQPAAA